MKTRIIAAIVALMLVAVPAGTALAATGSNICAGTKCAVEEVGPFMQNISKECGNLGTCALDDIQMVFENIANYVLGIVAALVLLMYVIGGIKFLVSGLPGQEKQREEGKKALKTSTIGLVIVFGAFAFMHTLFGVLQGSGLGGGPAGGYKSCGPGATGNGDECALNSQCSEYGLCVSKCLIDPLHATVIDSAAGTTVWWECFDNTVSKLSNGVVKGNQETKTELTGLCPGPATELCTQFTYTSK